MTGWDGGLVKGSACWESGAEFPRGRSTSDAAVGPGVGVGFVWRGYKFRASASRGCKDKVGHWEPAALRIQPERKLGVKRDGAVGLDVKLERGRKAQGCATAHMLESQLCFVFASNPPPLPERKTAKCGPQLSSVVLKMHLWVVMERAGRKKIDVLRAVTVADFYHRGVVCVCVCVYMYIVYVLYLCIALTSVNTQPAKH